MNPGSDFILKTDKKLKTVYGFNKQSESHVFTIPDFYSEGFLIEYLEKEPDIQCTMVQWNSHSQSWQKLIVAITGKISNDFRLFKDKRFQPVGSAVLV